VEVVLEFERPIVELELKIGQLESLSESTGMNLNGELKPLQNKLDRMRREIYDNLSPYDIVQVARHPLRPQTSDYLTMVFDEFVELHGDKHYGDDRALIAGFAKLGQYKLVLAGQQQIIHQQRLLRAAVLIGYRSSLEIAPAIQRIQANVHALRRNAAGRIQNVCCQFPHAHHYTILCYCLASDICCNNKNKAGGYDES